MCRIILNLSSEATHASETASTLRFGECLSVVKQRSKSSAIGPARALVHGAADEMSGAASDDLGDPSPTLEDTIEALQARLAELNVQLQQLAASGQDGRAADASGFSQAALAQFDGYKAELARVRAAALTTKQQISEVRSRNGGLMHPAVPTPAATTIGGDIDAAPVATAAMNRIDTTAAAFAATSAIDRSTMDIKALQLQLGQLRSREAVLVGMVVRQASMGLASTPSQAWVSKQAEVDALRAKLDRLGQLLPP